ncbi:MAG: pyrroline-5-carboxylate reductase [Succinivibrionaceae bacterium]|nr:pyrroline-5-carboxylate reductase [Succinivibrionaceae bacterium]
MASIAFIGGGNMARCIFDGLPAGSAGPITVSGPHPGKLGHFAERGARVTASNLEAAQGADLVFLAVKPQILPSVLGELAAGIGNWTGKLVVSMAAGFPLARVAGALHSERVVRIMPNTPARIGLGVIGTCALGGASAADLSLVRTLLSPLGTLIATDEAGIDVIGVAGGCGPAFVYRFLEALTRETAARGFAPEEARAIAEATAIGAATLAARSHGESLEALREAVTSKGGTTYAGLCALSAAGFDESIARAFAASMERTRELSGATNPSKE